MVRWEGVMWRRLTLTLLLASIASSSSSSGGGDGGGNKNKSGRGNNGTACPESCRCTRIQPAENDSNISDIGEGKKSTEIRCKGKAPGLEFLTVDVRRLVLEDAKPQEIATMLIELESRSGNSSGDEIGEEKSDRRSQDVEGQNLRDFVFVNCSLRHLNLSLPSASSVFAKTVNLTSNEFDDTEALSLGDGNRVERLDLSDNRLSRLRSEAFAKFSRLTLLNLRGNSIEKVDEGAFRGLASLESLDLSENRLATLDDGVFVPLCLLQKLDLSGNKLAGVLGGGHQWFGALGRLKELDVSRNGLATGVRISNSSETGNGGEGSDHGTRKNPDREKSPVTLESLPIGLKVLRLAENPLTEVELSLVLGSGRRLETVDASRIGLDRVPSALTRSVRALTLSGNRLTGIRSGDFDSYPLLRLLDLSRNLVNSVEDDAFGRLENLEILDLSDNRLTEIPQSLPGSLLHLLLSRNSIARLLARDLQGVCKLKKLVISENAITEIEVGSTSQLGLLAELDISDNPIKQIPANTFGGPRSLVRVRMSGLTSLEWDREKRADMAFPVPAPEGLVALDLSGSPALAAQLLADEAALSACKSLRRLDLGRTNLTSLRSDLAYLLPQLHVLGLSDNRWNCSAANAEEILWLAEWIRQHEEIRPAARCATGYQRDSSEETIFLNQLTSQLLGLDGESSSTERATSSSIIFPRESQLLASTRNQPSTAEPRSTAGRLISDRNNDDDDVGRSSPSTPNTLTDNAPNAIDTTEASTFASSGDNVVHVGATMELGNSTAANNHSLRFAGPKESGEPGASTKTPDPSIADSISSTETPDPSIGESISSTASTTAELVGENDYSTSAVTQRVSTIGVAALDGNVEPINDTVAEELIGREETAKTLSRTAEVTSTAIGAHPGMLVIVGAVLGAVVALSVVLSRRVTLAGGSRMRSVVLLDRESYRRQENIEVHSMDHQQQHQQQQPPPTITDLW